LGSLHFDHINDLFFDQFQRAVAYLLGAEVGNDSLLASNEKCLLL